MRSCLRGFAKLPSWLCMVYEVALTASPALPSWESSCHGGRAGAGESLWESSWHRPGKPTPYEHPRLPWARRAGPVPQFQGPGPDLRAQSSGRLGLPGPQVDHDPPPPPAPTRTEAARSVCPSRRRRPGCGVPPAGRGVCSRASGFLVGMNS
jgi:hypothetical protein